MGGKKRQICEEARKKIEDYLRMLDEGCVSIGNSDGDCDDGFLDGDIERLYRLHGNPLKTKGRESFLNEKDDIYVFVAYPPNEEFDHFYVFVGEFAEGRDTMNLLKQYGKIERKASKSGVPYCVYAIPRNYVIRGFEPFYRAVYIFSDKRIRDFIDAVGRGKGDGAPKNESREQ